MDEDFDSGLDAGSFESSDFDSMDTGSGAADDIGAWMDEAPGPELFDLPETAEFEPVPDSSGLDGGDVSAWMDAVDDTPAEPAFEAEEVPAEPAAAELEPPEALPPEVPELDGTEEIELPEDRPPEFAGPSGPYDHPMYPGEQEDLEVWMQEDQDAGDTLPDSWNIQPEELLDVPVEEVPEMLEVSDVPAEEVPETEEVSDVPAEEVPETEEVSDVPVEEVPEMEEVSDVPAEEVPETEEVSDVPAEEVPETEEVSDVPVEEVPEMPEVSDVPAEEVPEMEEVSDVPAEEVPEMEEVSDVPAEEVPETEEVSDVPVEEVPETEEVSDVPAEEVPEMEEVSDVPAEEVPEMEEVSDVPAEEVPETEEVSDTDDRSALDQMSDYMSEHNYGKDDFAEYSQDPEWQRLNNQLLQEQEIPPTAAEQLNLYMSEHNYGIGDYPEYSQDPEWQRLNAAYVEAPDTPIPVTPYDQRIDAVPPAAEEIPEIEEAPDVPVEEVPEMAEVSDIPVEEIPEMAEVSDVPVEEVPEMAEVSDVPVEEVPEMAEVSDVPVEEIPEMVEVSDVPAEEVPEMAEVSDVPTEEISEMAEEVPEVEEVPELVEEVPEITSTAYYEQGDNEYGFEGTCGPTSIANGLNHLLGTGEFTENEVLTEAIQADLCAHDFIDPAENGGTTTDQFVELYEHMNETCGGQLNIERYDFDDVLPMEEVARRLDEGCVVNVAVDADTLWGQSAADLMGTPPIEKATDHWITVTGVDRDESGGITGFHVIDSGGGVDYVDAQTYQTMCYGSGNLHLDDPTCIVVSRNDVPAEAAASGPAADVTAAVQAVPADVPGESPPAPSLAETGGYFEELPPETLERCQAGLERMTEEEQRVYLDAVAAEPAITRDIAGITAAAGGSNVGLEYRLKTPDSLYGKLHERDTVTDIHDVHDILRYTTEFPPETLAQGTNDSLAHFEEMGYTVQEVKNTWEDDTNPYNGINVKLISPSGQPLEMQYHTPESFELKNGPMHQLYEQWRELPEDSEQARDLQNDMFALSRQLRVPDRISEVRRK